MNRFIFVIMLLFHYSFGFSQNFISKDQAYRILRQNVSIDTTKSEVLVSKYIFPPDTFLSFFFEKEKSPSFYSWFFLIDDNPDANWHHPCRYVFINALGNFEFILRDRERGADFPMDYIYKRPLPKSLEDVSSKKK